MQRLPGQVEDAIRGGFRCALGPSRCFEDVRPVDPPLLLRPHGRPGTVVAVSIGREDECRCGDTLQTMASCTCEPLGRDLRRAVVSAHGSGVAIPAELRERRQWVVWRY